MFIDIHPTKPGAERASDAFESLSSGVSQRRKYVREVMVRTPHV